MTQTPHTPAGWYPQGDVQRWWDGNAWTEHTQPAAGYVGSGTPGTATTTITAEAAPKKQRRFPTKWWHWALIALGVIVFVSIIVNGANGDAREAAEQKPVVGSSEEAVDEPEVPQVTVPDLVGLTQAEAAKKLKVLGLTLDVGDEGDYVITSQDPAAGSKIPEDELADMTITSEKPLTEEEKLALAAEKSLAKAGVAKQNALEQAQSYLEYSSFSRAGLLHQMTSEYGSGFEAEDAAWAIRYLEKFKLVSWKAEAVEQAESYLEYSSFSRDGLYRQMTSEYGSQFTPEETNYALSKVGY